MNLYDSLKDKDIIQKTNEVFYDKVYKHPWLSQYFHEVPRDFITTQQTKFITGAIGGPNIFTGRMPSNAHTHMFITDELFELRQNILKDALEEVNAPEELRNTWLKIDYAFKNIIVKASVEDCKKRFKSDEILNFRNPDNSV